MDDDDEDRERYAGYLTSEGFVVEQARDEKEALARVRVFAPDVVLADLEVWAAVRIIKSDAATRDIHVLAVSSRDDDDSRHRAMEAGCDRFLAKPISRAALVDQMVACMIRKASRAVRDRG